MSNTNIHKIPLDKFNDIVKKLKLNKDNICNNTEQFKDAFLKALESQSVTIEDEKVAEQKVTGPPPIPQRRPIIRTTIPSVSTSEGQSIPSVSTSEGQSTPSVSTSEEQSIPSVSTSDGQSIQSVSTSEGQSIPSVSTNEEQSTSQEGVEIIVPGPSNICENDIKIIRTILETISDDIKPLVNDKLNEIIKICDEYTKLRIQYMVLENEYNQLDDNTKNSAAGKTMKSRLDEMSRILEDKIKIKDKLVKEIEQITGKKTIMSKLKGRINSLFSKKPTDTTISSNTTILTDDIKPSAPPAPPCEEKESEEKEREEKYEVRGENQGFLSSLFGNKKQTTTTTTNTITERLGAPVICHDINSDNSKKYMIDTDCEEKINNLRKEMDKMTQKISENDILRKKYSDEITSLKTNNLKVDESKKQLETQLADLKNNYNTEVSRLNNELKKIKDEYLQFQKRKEDEFNKLSNLSKGEKDDYTRKTLQEKTDLSNKLVQTKDELDKLKAQYQQNLNQLGSTNKYEKGQMNERITKLYNDYQVRLNTLRNNQQVELDNLRKRLTDLDREKQVLGSNVNKLENERQNILSGFKNLQDKYNQLQREGAYTNQQKDANIQNMLRQYEDRYKQLQQQNIRMTQEIDRKNNLIMETERIREAYNNLQNKYRELMEAPAVLDYEEEEARQRELDRVKSEYDMLKQQYNTSQSELRTVPVLPTIQPMQQPTAKKSIFNRLFGTEPEPAPQTITQPPLLQPQTITQASLLQTQPESDRLLTTEPAPEEEETSFFKRIMDVVSPKEEETEIRAVDTSPILKMPTPVELGTTEVSEITEKEEPKIIYRSRPCKRKSSKKKKSSKRKKTSQRKQSLQPIIYIQTSYDGKDNVSVSKGNITFPRKPRSQKKSSQKLSKKKSCSKIKSLTK
jgi:hypothetical protein